MIREVCCTTRCFVYKKTAVVFKTAKGNLRNKTGLLKSVEHKYTTKSEIKKSASAKFLESVHP